MNDIVNVDIDHPCFARFGGGGPLDGETLQLVGMAWPLPAEFAVADGAYVKVSESRLTEDVPHVARGAQYEWRAA